MTAYPSGIFPWTNRVDTLDVVWAADPDSLAAEIIALENTEGINPQVMKNPMLGNPITFGSVDVRLDYLTMGQHLPVCSLTGTQQLIQNNQGAGTDYGQFNVYSQNYDPFGMFNGADVTIPVTGWYVVDAGQFWDWWSTGYNAIHLWAGNLWKRTAKWQWDFTGNSTASGQIELTGQQSAPNYWQAGSGVQREGSTWLTWQGILNAGTRLRIVSENGTSDTPHRAYNMEFSVSCTRLTPTTVVQTTPTPPVVPTAPQVTQYPAPSGLTVSALNNTTLLVKWNNITYPTPVPESYTIAVYQMNGVESAYVTVNAPDMTGGTSQGTITNLVAGWEYNVDVWANGGLIAPPHAQNTITMP